MSIQPGLKEDISNRPKLLDQVRNKIRLKNYSIRTEQAYVDWTRRFIRFLATTLTGGLRQNTVEPAQRKCRKRDSVQDSGRLLPKWARSRIYRTSPELAEGGALWHPTPKSNHWW
jgi:hypothetical protein